MSKIIYTNTKSGATVELTEQSYSNLSKKMQQKYRRATEAEEKLHASRMETTKAIAARRDKQKKARAAKGGQSVKDTEKASKKSAAGDAAGETK